MLTMKYEKKALKIYRALLGEGGPTTLKQYKRLSDLCFANKDFKLYINYAFKYAKTESTSPFNFFLSSLDIYSKAGDTEYVIKNIEKEQTGSILYKAALFSYFLPDSENNFYHQPDIFISAPYKNILDAQANLHLLSDSPILEEAVDKYMQKYGKNDSDKKTFGLNAKIFNDDTK